MQRHWSLSQTGRLGAVNILKVRTERQN